MNWDGLTPPYHTIVADPPWPYENAGPKPGKATQDTRLSGPAAKLRYSLMSIEELCAMPVAEIAADDAHLYLWTTNAFMVEAHEIARAWGFKPKTILTWVKTFHDDRSRVSMKTGYYFRGASEHMIFAVRGSLPLRTTEGLPTAYLWPRLGHSIKPPASFDLIEKASPGPYVELFSRQPRFGWDSWGLGFERPQLHDLRMTTR